MTQDIHPADPHLAAAAALIEGTMAGRAARPVIRGFFDENSCTMTYVVHDPATKAAAIIDSVLDFDPVSGSIAPATADQVVAYVLEEQLTVDWLLETHIHADHLSAAPYLQDRVGGTLATSRRILEVQEIFGKLFNAGTEFVRDGSQFGRLFADGDRFRIGGVEAVALHVPGHTPADTAYVIGDAVFVGDTLFMPDSGTARADFPGGDARQLYASIKRLLALPHKTRLFLCHDYKAPRRYVHRFETTVEAQRSGNIHVRDGIGEDDFVRMRTERDRTLSMPRLLMPSVQVNMRAGQLPPPEQNGTRYIKIPISSPQ